MKGIKGALLPLCGAVTVAVQSLSVNAAEWSSSASVTPAVVYTDNVCLTRDNKQDDWIGVVTPRGSVTANGNRANFTLGGSIEFNSLTDSDLEDFGCRGGSNGDRQQWSPRVRGNGDVVVVDDWFYVDGTVYATQNQVSPFLNGGGDSYNRTGNTNTSYGYSVSPYISRRFKDDFRFKLRYTWDEQLNSEDVVADSTEERVSASLRSIPGTARWSWGLRGNYSKVKYDDVPGLSNGRDNELSSARFNTGYQFNRAWQGNATYGYEWNDFVSISDDIDGDFWDVGFRWTPNSRTTIAAGTGERFFGSTQRFSATYRHKRSELSASYDEDITYNRNIRDQDDLLPPDLDQGQTTLTNSPILDERFTLAYVYTGKVTRFRVNAFESQQTRADLGFDTEFRGVSVSARRSLNSRMNLTAGLRWNENDPVDTPDIIRASSDTWRANLGWDYQLSESINAGINYQYLDRSSDSSNPGNLSEYTENRVTFLLRIDF